MPVSQGRQGAFNPLPVMPAVPLRRPAAIEKQSRKGRKNHVTERKISEEIKAFSFYT